MNFYCNAIKRCFIILLCSTVLLTCNQGDNDISPTSSDTQSVLAFLIADNGLIISLLTDDKDNETYYFEGFVFNFNSNGSVVATNGSDTVNGSYDVFRDDGRVELYMDFPNIGNFDELDDDWYFISIDQNTIRFNDDGDRLEFRPR